MTSEATLVETNLGFNAPPTIWIIIDGFNTEMGYSTKGSWFLQNVLIDGFPPQRENTARLHSDIL